MTEGYATENEGLKHIASALRSARRSKKLKFPTITETIRIREDYLRAMEDGAFDQLPGGVYTRSHLKSYSEFLGLDSAPLLERLDKELGSAPKEDEVSLAPEPFRTSFSPNPLLIVVSLLTCVAAYALWQRDAVPPAPPVNERQKEVVAVYTDPAPIITLVANSEAQVRVVGPKGGVLLDAPLHNGDTYFVPENKEVTLHAAPAGSVTLYVDGEEVVSLDNLEIRNGGLVLNREKLLANTAVH